MTPGQFEEFTAGMDDDQFDCLAGVIQDALDLQVQNHHTINALHLKINATVDELQKERASHAELQKFIAVMNLSGYLVSGVVWEDIQAGLARVIQVETSMDKRLLSHVQFRENRSLRPYPISARTWNPEQKLEAQEIEYE